MLVKVLNNSMLHFGFQYTFGLNVLNGKLNTNANIPVGEGGLYFCEIEQLDAHVYRGDMVCVVEIPKDAIVIPLHLNGNAYFRTDKLVLTNKIYRFDSNKDVHDLVQLNPNLQDYLNDPCFIRLDKPA